MNKITYLLFLFSPFIVSSHLLTFDFSTTTIESNRQWARVQLFVTGGQAPYLFSFTYLPKQWRQVRHYVYLPKRFFNETMRFPCGVVVRDANEVELRAVVIFETKNKKLSVNETTYPYDYEFPDQFFQQNDYSGKPQIIKYEDLNQKIIDVKKQKPAAQNRSIEEATSLVSTAGSGLQIIVETLNIEPENAAQNIIKKIGQDSQSNKPKRPIDSIFNSFPSPSELDQIILTADAFLITKTIQKIVSSTNLNCQQKIAYLADFFARIQSAIEMKRFTAEQLKVIIEGAEAQTKRLENEIEFENKRIQNLNLKQIKDQYTQQLLQLELFYDQFNDNELKIEAEEEQQKKVSFKMQRLKDQQTQVRLVLLHQQLEFVTAVNTVQALEKELLVAKNKQTDLEKEIVNTKGEINNIENQIKNYTSAKAEIQRRIKNIKDKSDSLKLKYSQQEIKVERVREENLKALKKEKQIRLMVRQLEQRLYFEELKLRYRQLELLQNLLQVLNRNLPNIQEDIDTLYYSCFKAENLRSQLLQNGILIYVLNAKNFIDYLSNAYSANVPSPSITEVVTLTTSSILDVVWEATFGRTFNQSAIVESQQFRFPNDFNCLNPSTLENGHGIIRKIQKNKIQIEEDEQIVHLELSLCSRIQSVTILPIIGQRLYWRGNKVGENSYEVYSASAI